MAKFNLTPKRALTLFIAITVVLVAQATWWIIFMARLVDEKVQMAIDLGADPSFVDLIHQQEIRRQIMVGSEGLFMLLLVGIGAWLIYRALVKAEELKFHQQNFLMAVTHELKTPLASIKIYLDTLESAKIPEEKKTQIIPRLKEDANRLEKLVENVLEAGRFERNGYQLNIGICDFSKLVDDSLKRARDYPSKKPVRVNRIRFDEGVLINGDCHALGRAIGAIIENSIIYSDKREIEIKVNLRRDGQSVVLVIADNGIGLARKDASQIFNRFYRVGSELSSSRPGTGLGLYLCREIIRAHGGKVNAHSEGPGKGTEIKIALKAMDSDEENPAG